MRIDDHIQSVDDAEAIWIDPGPVWRLSEVSGAPKSQMKLADMFGFEIDGEVVRGDWDVTKKSFEKYLWEYDRWLNDEGELVYEGWTELVNSIRQEGYRYEPDDLVPICFGRSGEILLVDGRHRMVVAKKLCVPEIPTRLAYTHEDYDFGKLHLLRNPCVPGPIHRLICARFPEGPLYHSLEEVYSRYLLVRDFLPALSDLNVLDLGCNSAFMSWAIKEHALSYHGVEPNAGYFEQAQTVLSCFRSRFTGYVEHTNLANSSWELCNALYASFVLYHLRDDEVEYLVRRVLPHMKVVLVPNRNMERPSARAGKPRNRWALNNPYNIATFLRAAGLETEIWDNGKYSVVTGRR